MATEPYNSWCSSLVVKNPLFASINLYCFYYYSYVHPVAYIIHTYITERWRNSLITFGIQYSQLYICWRE